MCPGSIDLHLCTHLLALCIVLFSDMHISIHAFLSLMQGIWISLQSDLAILMSLKTLNQNNRRACFDVTINSDQAFENTETFSLLLSFDELVPESVRSIVTIEPSVVYVTIEDTTGMQNVSKIFIACRYFCT